VAPVTRFRKGQLRTHGSIRTGSTWQTLNAVFGETGSPDA
jgi:hypothetical protein